MARIIVLGGRGFFGAAIADRLRRDGERPLVASRRPGGDLIADAEDPDSLRAALGPRDIVIDSAGPFQRRSTALIETAVAIGCDLIDLSDSLQYHERVQRLAPLVDGSRSRVLTSCSSVSAVSAALVALLDVANPMRVSSALAPATRNTSTYATSQSLFESLERPIRIWRNGGLIDARAFGERRTFDFAEPVGRVEGWLDESADAVALPRIWPSLREVDFWVSLRRRVLDHAIATASRHGVVRSALRVVQPIGRRLARMIGARSGGFGVEVELGSGERRVAGFVHHAHSYIVAIAPAVLAARSIAAGSFADTGLVTADRHVSPRLLADYLAGAGVEYFTAC